MDAATCLFCNSNDEAQHNLIDSNELAYARWDNFPASKGHAEVIPKRHVASFFDLSSDELQSLYALMKTVRSLIKDKYAVDEFTIGINEGRAAGRTIDHLHIHIIPRYAGDVENPRGGVRHVIPGKGSY